MKKLLVSLMVAVLAVLPLHYSEASKSPSVKVFDSIGLNVQNSTTYDGALYVYGPTSVSTSLPASSATSYGPLTAGYYTINVYTSAPGTRTFSLNGQSVTTDQGYATFNVNISYTSFLYIY